MSGRPHRRFPVRWRIFACLFGFAFFAYIQRTSVAITAERMMPELGLSQVQIGWLLTAFLLSYTAFQVPAGVLGQRLGARRTFVLASLLAMLATVATALLPAFLSGALLFVALLTARFTLGIAQAPVFPAASGSIESWFPRSGWSLPQGTLNSGLDLGAATASPLIAVLMQSVGWQAALVVTSVPLMLLAAYWARRARDVPALDPGVSQQELDELRLNPLPATGAPGVRRMLLLLRNRDLLLLTLSYLSMNYVFYLLTFWCFLYFVQERHFAALDSGWFAAAPFVAAGVGAVLGGRLNDALCRGVGDRWGFRAIPVVALPVAGVFLWIAVTAPSAYWADVALCVAFAAVEITEGPYWAASMRIAGSDSMVATGLLNTGGNVGGVLATPIIAALTAQHGWTAAFLTGSACAWAGAALWLGVDVVRGSSSSPLIPPSLPKGSSYARGRIGRTTAEPSHSSIST